MTRTGAAVFLAVLMAACIAMPWCFNRLEQEEANLQITCGTVTNKIAETHTESGKVETVYTIYISGGYFFDGEEKTGERELIVPLEVFMRYEIGDSISEDEINGVSETDTPP